MAQEGKVICVRLALFAEMMKGKSWTPATLKEVGGTEGVGVTFLEETFSAATAPPEHRYHQKAARAVLKALLPETGTDIKGNMRSYAELLEASGYAGRPKDFDDLIRILDSEIRLITPTDPEGKDERDGIDVLSIAAQARTLLPTDARLSGSFLAGLADPQAEGDEEGPGRIAAGGPGCCLECSTGEPAAAVAVAVAADQVVDAEKELDAAATEDDEEGEPVSPAAGCDGGGGPGAGGAGRVGRLWQNSRRMTCESASWKRTYRTCPRIVENMKPYRHWIDPLLRDAYQEAEANQDARKQLHASIALLPVDAGQVRLPVRAAARCRAAGSAGDPRRSGPAQG